MRRVPLFASTLALVLASGTALAVVTEPNGLVVPLDSANAEVQLYTFFQNQNDPVDWKADAHTTPNAFSPLCGFTATFVLNEAGSHFGLAWYNETGQKPPAADLHVLVPPNSPVGTTFNGTSIKNDPAYAGGLVGFALVGGETHYSNPAYNNLCSACNPPAPWITAVIYASKTTANAYYIAFEDGATTASGWNNDGDFNDDVYFLTGITCSGGGQPCDTGKPGVCASGVTQCTSNGVVCQDLSQPKGENCNGIDDDCNGTVDEGDICPSGYVCDKGTCVQSCKGGEFDCLPDQACNSNGYCVDAACKDVTCEAGKVCIGGTCKGPCDDVACPFPQVCRVGACVDPCAGVTCESGQVCDGGVCVTRCDCLPCAGGEACETSSGLCIEPSCIGVTCDAGTHCAGGTCVDNCMGAVCPTGQACMAGQCVEAPSSSDASSSSSGIFGSGGEGGAAGGGMGGAAASGGNSGSGGAGSGNAGSEGSCGCRVVGNDDATGAAWAALGMMGLAAMRRRRRAPQPAK
ncbi:MYXO-CTERM sorting domain-containing protein [Polyangium sp. 15x6]|uniref:MYXO-CTERM sorting domain-containing protein n=1 Tax=Polyangium sp. 15x6 TaxID=3042687 RepID=UPI00249A5172|nr:MYXO-CTERM sorting domain-containing protein [Polyangium sp. 15x6]MDI3289842.1 MYXO-CTERM sorting domain-containing protein [Polyangium sp. 15x6]